MNELEWSAHYFQQALSNLKAIDERNQSEYERGFNAGVASANGGARKVTGPQFLARLMNCVSPDSAGWSELHRLAESGFGNNLRIEDSDQ